MKIIKYLLILLSLVNILEGHFLLTGSSLFFQQGISMVPDLVMGYIYTIYLFISISLMFIVSIVHNKIKKIIVLLFYILMIPITVYLLEPKDTFNIIILSLEIFVPSILIILALYHTKRKYFLFIYILFYIIFFLIILLMFITSFATMTLYKFCAFSLEIIVPLLYIIMRSYTYFKKCKLNL